MKKIGILYHPKVEATYVTAQQLEAFLASQGAHAWLCSAWEIEKAQSKLDGTELVLSVGGDGTILRAAQVVFQSKIPLTGINLGTLGFMTELNIDEAQDKLKELFQGKGWTDERVMLEVALSPEGKKPSQFFHSLNDAVVARGTIARVITVEAYIDGKYLTSYRADGVIIATATGSTGYALAAGGPILHPQSKDFILVPIVPHLSLANALVLPPTSVVELKVKAVHEPFLNIDGHTNIPLQDGATVTVKISRHTVRFLRIHPQSTFFTTLERKLKGKKEIEYGRKS